MRKVQETENPDEADLIEQELGGRAIPFHLHVGTAVSGQSVYAFYVPDEHSEAGQAAADRVLARMISGNEALLDPGEARAIVGLHRKEVRKDIERRGRDGLLMAAWRFRLFALGSMASLLALPVASYVRPHFPWSDAPFWLSYVLLYVIVSIVFHYLIRMARG